MILLHKNQRQYFLVAEPASEEAVRALWAAAKNNGMDIESVCREYGVDPKHISKQECWQMTHDLNERSGYGK